jgi:hypothetical protein
MSNILTDNLLRRIRAHGVWIGISDDGDEGDWRWVNNSQADIDRFEWWPGKVPDFSVKLRKYFRQGTESIGTASAIIYNNFGLKVKKKKIQHSCSSTT